MFAPAVVSVERFALGISFCSRRSVRVLLSHSMFWVQARKAGANRPVYIPQWSHMDKTSRAIVFTPCFFRLRCFNTIQQDTYKYVQILSSPYHLTNIPNISKNEVLPGSEHSFKPLARFGAQLSGPARPQSAIATEAMSSKSTAPAEMSSRRKTCRGETGWNRHTKAPQMIQLHIQVLWLQVWLPIIWIKYHKIYST